MYDRSRKMVLVEICTDNLPDTLNAIRLGADRIELCSELEADGLTPSIELFNQCRQLGINNDVQIFPMVRCRAGNFDYSEPEKALMIDQACNFVRAGATGLVVGALKSNGKEIDIDFMRKFHEAVRAINPAIEITFHKAIDQADRVHARTISDDVESLEPYCRRILTSGGAPSAKQGSGCLKILVERRGAPKPIAAGRIRSENVLELIEATGVDEVHSRSAEICVTLGKFGRKV